MDLTRSREFIRQSLKFYADFFSAIVNGEEAEANQKLLAITELDREAGRILQGDALDYYLHKRSHLMKTFRKRLVSRLEDQLEKQVINDAEEVLQSLIASGQKAGRSDIRRHKERS